jgi:hypothetical protein
MGSKAQSLLQADRDLAIPWLCLYLNGGPKPQEAAIANAIV